MLEARFSLLYDIALSMHEGGHAIYPTYGLFGHGFECRKAMTFQERLIAIARCLQQHKWLVMDVIEERYTYAFLVNPEEWARIRIRLIQSRQCQSTRTKEHQDEVTADASGPRTSRSRTESGAGRSNGNVAAEKPNVVGQAPETGPAAALKMLYAEPQKPGLDEAALPESPRTEYELQTAASPGQVGGERAALAVEPGTEGREHAKTEAATSSSRPPRAAATRHTTRSRIDRTKARRERSDSQDSWWKSEMGSESE